MAEADSDHHVEASYDPETDTYHAKYQPDETGSLAGAVVYLVSVATGNDPKTMDPLYETIDVDALESLFRGQEGRTGHIEFQHCGCAVTAMSDGEIVVSPLDDCSP
ncbi:hypothetical protein BRD00_04545 [Halobacteriales archaeon QS_8_69_26]|nr:MAG: hypothetical protein BRD00_04545 [Halobacteriales archaeon QS_8_69_26]